MFAVAILTLAAIGLATIDTHGFAAARFDATSVETFHRSYANVVGSIPAAEVVPLELAVEKIIRTYALATGQPPAQSDLVRKFDGKTAPQIVALADRLDSPTLSAAERDRLAR